MRSSIMADCGHREQKRHIEDGECRNCRGVDKLTRVDRDHRAWTTDPYAAQRSRYRVIHNVAGKQ